MQKICLGHEETHTQATAVTAVTAVTANEFQLEMVDLGSSYQSEDSAWVGVGCACGCIA